MDWPFIVLLVTGEGVGLAVVGAIIKGGKWIARVTSKLEKIEDTVKSNSTALVKEAAKIDRIEKVIDRELRPNAGSSIRDRVVKIESTVEQLVANQ